MIDHCSNPKKKKKFELTFTSTSSMSTLMSSPPRLALLASQNRMSLVSTTDDQLPVFKSVKKTLESTPSYSRLQRHASRSWVID